MVSKDVRCTLRIMKSPFTGNVGGTADYIRPLLLARDFFVGQNETMIMGKEEQKHERETGTD